MDSIGIYSQEWAEGTNEKCFRFVHLRFTNVMHQHLKSMFINCKNEILRIHIRAHLLMLIKGRRGGNLVGFWPLAATTCCPQAPNCRQIIWNRCSREWLFRFLLCGPLHHKAKRGRVCYLFVLYGFMWSNLDRLKCIILCKISCQFTFPKKKKSKIFKSDADKI